ncbi:MAG TPA: YicC/YloC family endoribonuclease [Planctomycetota bacterium]|nr:YicC/YloC family endoribonuclease [Planctomycetota bacterium]
MTGYAIARETRGGLGVEVEVRSVNHRSLAIQVRLPSELAGQEPGFEERVRDKLHRGSVSLAARVLRSGSIASEAVIDVGQARAVADALRRLARELRLPGEVTIAQVASAPGVLGAQRNGSADPRLGGLAEKAHRRALDALLVEREREGAALARDLRDRLGRMRERLAEIEERTPRVLVEHRDRLRRRLDELVAGTSAVLREEDLAREVALLAERSDVAEEIARLRVHLDEAASLLGKREPVGRRLEFLAQELHREVNTIGSKSSDLAITQAVLGLKAEVDRIREQVANLE